MIFLGLILRLFGKKVVYDIHENYPAAILSKPYIKSSQLKRFISKVFYFFEIFSARFFSKIVTARPDISKIYLTFNPITLNNFPILNNNLDENYTKKLIKKKKAIIYVGGLAEIRGIKQLIQAFEGIEKAELWLLGPWQNENFYKYCKTIPGWENTRYLGVVSPTQVSNYLLQADIGIITFLPFPNHLTTLATKPFEYMQAGLPIIMSNFDYWVSFYKDLAKYVDPSNSTEIRRVILDLLDNPEEMKRMGTSGKNKVKKEYNWRIEEAKLINLYKQIT